MITLNLIHIMIALASVAFMCLLTYLTTSKLLSNKYKKKIKDLRFDYTQDKQQKKNKKTPKRKYLKAKTHFRNNSRKLKSYIDKNYRQNKNGNGKEFLNFINNKSYEDFLKNKGHEIASMLEAKPKVKTYEVHFQENKKKEGSIFLRYDADAITYSELISKVSRMGGGVYTIIFCDKDHNLIDTKKIGIPFSSPKKDTDNQIEDVLKKKELKSFAEIEEFFNKDKKRMEKYIEAQNKHNFGDPSSHAFKMVEYYKSDRKWAEKIIENAKVGDPAYAAYLMVRYNGSDRKWAEKVIESSKTGNPSFSAYSMVRDCGSDRKWAEKVIEKSTTGNPSRAAYDMVRDCGSDRKWAEKVIENAEVGYPSLAAYDMVSHCGSNIKWAEGIIENAEIGNPSEAAFCMVKYCGSDRKWAENVIKNEKTGNPENAKTGVLAWNYLSMSTGIHALVNQKLLEEKPFKDSAEKVIKNEKIEHSCKPNSHPCKLCKPLGPRWVGTAGISAINYTYPSTYPYKPIGWTGANSF